ncbi:MAG: AI-2E family transporter [Candidatus Shapirobacteria bacterium]
MKPNRVEISFKTIVSALLLLMGAFVLWKVKDMIFLIFICFIFMEALSPTVSKLEKHKLPRPLAIIIIYLLILGIIYFAFAGIIPILIDQTTGLINTLPTTLKNASILGFPLSNVNWSSQLGFLQNLPSNLARLTISIASNLLSTFVVFVITYYLLLERKNLSDYGQRLLGNSAKVKIQAILDQLELRLGSWVNAEIFLMTLVGLMSYIGYLLIGIQFAVPLAIVAGLLEIVPNIGPVISTGMAVLIGFTISPITGLLAVLVGIIVHQSENNIIVPNVMKSTVGLHPLITIVLIASGAKLAGIAGAVLAVPVYLTAEVIIKVLFAPKK